MEKENKFLLKKRGKDQKDMLSQEEQANIQQFDTVRISKSLKPIAPVYLVANAVALSHQREGGGPVHYRGRSLIQVRLQQPN